MKMKQLSKCLLGLFLLIIMLLLTACDGFTTNASPATKQSTHLPGDHNPGPPTFVDGPVAYMAKLLQNQLTGALANTYTVAGGGIPTAPSYGPQNATDPLWVTAQNYWYNDQHCWEGTLSSNGKQTLCHMAYSGYLQCVEFVTAVYGMVQDPLPFIGNGQDFYPGYVGRAGWKTLPANKYINQAYKNFGFEDLPQKGDMAGFGGGAFGHIAIVVNVQKPGDTDGYITLANANAPGTTFPHSPQAGNFATFTWKKDGSFAPSPSLFGTGEFLQGFIRHVDGHPKIALLSSMLKFYGLTGLSSTQQQWASLAIIQAQRFKISPLYFVKQIKQESGFNPKAKSSAGAIGIAQFMPDTAAAIPRCILNPSENDPMNCEKHDSRKGIDPNNPSEAIPAAAYTMATHYQHYLKKCDDGSSAENCHIDATQAEARSLAAYNAGRGETDTEIDACGKGWLLCMDLAQSSDHQTKNYIAIIMGCNVVVASGAVCTKT